MESVGSEGWVREAAARYQALPQHHPNYLSPKRSPPQFHLIGTGDKRNRLAEIAAGHRNILARTVEVKPDRANAGVIDSTIYC